MQDSTVSPVTNTTVFSNSTSVTKTTEQILIQSSGAMIALIVVGIILILAVLLIILKTYNRYTHASRVLGAGSSKPRPKTQSMSQSTVPLTDVHVSSVSDSISQSRPASENGFRLPNAELSMMEGNHIEQFSTNSGSTVVTIHGPPSVENT
ncbi:noncompact myelin-associated protein [Gouania willdenowi]|uniref:noncompact myelin-associated protein n=1 Tax=Gouania willdenowi TaxID=441366 RepID=UPI001056A768|nr:noncompact myelin-associated protein [Gouania willdenowi]